MISIGEEFYENTEQRYDLLSLTTSASLVLMKEIVYQTKNLPDEDAMKVLAACTAFLERARTKISTRKPDTGLPCNPAMQ